jgi:hypothetical protein
LEAKPSRIHNLILKQSDILKSHVNFGNVLWVALPLSIPKNTTHKEGYLIVPRAINVRVQKSYFALIFIFIITSLNIK